METIDLILRQQQVTIEKAEEADKLGKREYFRYLATESDSFLEDKNPRKRLVLIPGLRGIGKTTLLLQLYQHLRSKVSNKQLFFFTLDEMSGFDVNMREMIATMERELTNKPLAMVKEKLVFILDEIHYAVDWNICLKLLYDQGHDVLIIASGSSSLKIKESADLARRRIMKPMYPFQLREYLELNKFPFVEPFDLKGVLESKKGIADLEKNLDKNWDSISFIRTHGVLVDYLIHGGFPFRRQDSIRSMQDLISKIIHKDIEEVMEDVDSFMVEKLVNYLAVSRTGETSIDKLSQKLGISKPTVLKYLDLLEKTELIFSVRPYSSSSKAVRASIKYYLASSSLKAAILDKLVPDIHRSEVIGELLETAVFSSIRNNLTVSGVGHRIYYDTNGCDFVVCLENGISVPIEVKKGEESASQLARSIKNTNATVGIMISSLNELRSKGKILYLPKELFLLM
ncbi:MAG: ATP-binding protein [Candidatus Micrarchaeota archaeon]